MSSSVIALRILGESGIMYDINKFIYFGATEGVAHQVFYTKRELAHGWAIGPNASENMIRPLATSAALHVIDDARLIARNVRK